MTETKNHSVNNEDYAKYYDVLEIKPDSSFQEVKNAYLHLKKLYSSDAPVLIPVMDEMSEEHRLEILNRLEDAYAHLKEYYKVEEKEKASSTRQWAVTHNVPEFAVFTGNALKLTREVLGIDLKEIALFTGVPLGHLRNIELERLDLLPPQGYVKVFLRKYAEYLALNPQKVINDYMVLFDRHKKK
jgi:hypothetical protein